MCVPRSVTVWVTLLVSLVSCLPVPAETLRLRTADIDNNFAQYNRNDKQFPGACIEIMRAIEVADPDIHFVTEDTPSLPLVRLQVYVRKGSLDALCGLFKTPAREANFRFTATPLYLARHQVAVRMDDDVVVHNFDDIRQLGRRGMVMTTQGSSLADYLREQGGLWVDADNKDIGVMLRRLASGYGRFFYHTEATIQTYIRHEGLQGKLKMLPVVFREEPIYLVLGRHVSPEDARRLESVLAQLASQGVLRRIYRRYSE